MSGWRPVHDHWHLDAGSRHDTPLDTDGTCDTISVFDIPKVDIVPLDPTEFLPLTAMQFHIMASLAREPRHGYGVMQEVERRSGGRVKVRPGTLYTALKRMLEDGLVRELDTPPPATDSADDRRRYYALTALGLSVLRADARRLAELVRYARAERLLGGSES
jgi:DNA-binding PadR family transcriptional regulator